MATDRRRGSLASCPAAGRPCRQQAWLRARCDQAMAGQPGGQRAGQRGLDRPVGPVELGPGSLAAQDRDFMTEHQGLGVLSRLAAVCDSAALGGLLSAGAGTAAGAGRLPMLSMIGHPGGDKPLMMDVRQSGSGSS
jgi:hypothetical protein